jgi:hypothetical protein
MRVSRVKLARAREKKTVLLEADRRALMKRNIVTCLDTVMTFEVAMRLICLYQNW